MSRIENINYEATIEENKIILKSKRLELVDNIIFFISSIIYSVIIILAFLTEGIKNDIKIWDYLTPLFVLFIFYLSYKKINEKKLLRIKTPLNKIENRNFIIDFVKHYNLKIPYNNQNYLIAEIPFSITGAGKQITFLFENNTIKVNCLSLNPFVRLPLLWFDYSLKKELENKVKQLGADK